MLYMNYPRCGDCAFSASFVRECTDLSLLLRCWKRCGVNCNKSVVVEKIKEVERRSRRAQLFMAEIIIELGYSHAPSKFPVKKLRRLLQKRRKVRVFVWKGIWKNIISYYSSVFTIHPQPRRRSVRSHSVLFSLTTRYGSTQQSDKQQTLFSYLMLNQWLFFTHQITLRRTVAIV